MTASISLVRAPMSLRSALVEVAARAGACRPSVPHLTAAPARFADPAAWRPDGGTPVTSLTAHTCTDTRHDVIYLRGSTLGRPRLWRARLTVLGLELSETVPADAVTLAEWWDALTGPRTPATEPR